MPDIFSSIKSYGVAALAAHHGLTVQADKSFGPCPACGAKHRHTKRHDPRLACIIVQSGNGWECIQCNAKGDTVDLVARLYNGGKKPSRPDEWRAALERFRLGGAVTLPPPVRNPLESNARGLPDGSAAMVRPPYPDVMALWNRSLLVPPDRVRGWLVKKFPNYTIEQLMDAGIVRFMPKHDNPDWWPWGYDFMAMLAFDHHGLVQSIHARVCSEPEPGRPKSRFPKGFAASGLVLGNKTAVSWLRGKMPMSQVVIAEGLTSTLAATMAMRATGKWDWGVLGYTSGSNKAIEQMPWTNQTVYVLTDNDKVGDMYAEKIMSVIPAGLNLRRGKL